MALTNAEVAAKPVSVTLDDERPRPDSPDQATFRHHLARYEFALRFIEPHFEVLETACGTGYGSQLLAGKARRVLATDYSAVAIEYARHRYPAPTLEYAVLDCNHLAALHAQFDCIVSFEVLEHLAAQKRYLQACWDILRPGGLLLISTPNHSTASIHMQSIGQKNDFHIGELDLATFRKLLQSVFPQHILYGQRRKGNSLYSTIRAMDIWNLRLRLISNERREKIQGQLGVAHGAATSPSDWVFKKTQLRQANNFLAVCRKAG